MPFRLKLLDRYILQQILLAGSVAVAVLTAILVLGNIFKQLLDLLVDQRAPLDTVIAFIAYVIPASSVYTIPWGFLTAVLLVFSRLSAENELTAMRTSGLSIGRIAAPVLILALLLSGLCLWVNLTIAPQAQERMRSSILNIATENPIALFANDHVIEEFPGRRIYVGRKDGTTLYDLFDFQLVDERHVQRVVFAKRGELITDLEGKSIRMRLYDARVEEFSAEDPLDYESIQHGIALEETTITIPLEELIARNQERRGFSSLTAIELQKMIEEREDTTRARTELHKRWSFSLACITFALVGIPLGVTTQRRETSAGFGVSLLVAFAYFIFIEVANTLRDTPAAQPHLIMWLPNFVLGGFGIWLFRRLQRR
ncbi:MAG: LptF/LptG family permease [Verrucomicrobiales bacterium]